MYVKTNACRIEFGWNREFNSVQFDCVSRLLLGGGVRLWWITVLSKPHLRRQFATCHPIANRQTTEDRSCGNCWWKSATAVPCDHVTSIVSSFQLTTSSTGHSSQLQSIDIRCHICATTKSGSELYEQVFSQRKALQTPSSATHIHTLIEARPLHRRENNSWAAQIA